nr:EF-P lysine aminoacylase GenX [Gammaproteobacteria bacterium]
MDLLGSWQPTATIEQLTQNAAIVRLVREYMQEQGVLEVITPSLSRFTTTDPNIESVAACVMGDTRYLHTSPEFPMKRLLAAYQTSIYQITKVFRDGEVGARHNTEFSMLEWYRVGYSMEDLMKEIEQLLKHIFGSLDQPLESSNTVSYVSTVQTLLDCSFESVTTAKIRSHFHDHSRSFPESIDDVDSALDLLLDEFVIPGFASNRLTF